MINYIYDGTFEGLLTAIYEAYYRPEPPQRILCRENLQESLFEQNVHIPADAQKAAKVYNAVREKISPESLENIFYVFHSEVSEAGTWIYQYLRLGWKTGSSIDQHLSDDRVLRIINLKRKVAFECHRMMGLVRFVCLEGNLYYSQIAPDYNITALLAPHFAERLADQNWVIHDVKRNFGAFYNLEGWVMSEIPQGYSPALEEKGVDYKDLWKKYFKTIAISSRTNLKLQRRFMPTRYWHYLTEKQ